MTSSELAKFKKQVEGVFEKHNYHPAIVFFQPPKSRRIMVLFVGAPSVEWISKAGEYQMKRFEQFIMTQPNLAPILTRHN